MTIELKRDASLAVVLSDAIGDSLITLVLVNNLCRNGYAPTVFGWVAHELAQWLPHVNVGGPASNAAHVAPRSFDAVIELHSTAFGRSLSRSGETIVLSRLENFAKADHMIDRMAGVCSRTFGLIDVIPANGLVMPGPGARNGALPRVVIHPGGSHAGKIWCRKKFVAVARELAARGMTPGIVVTPAERPDWEALADQGIDVHTFAKLADLAAWMAHAELFIGNDSGVGHLASAIGVPTVSVFMRRSLARAWRPGWAPGAVVTPSPLVPTGKLKERYWKQLISPARVLREVWLLRSALRAGQIAPATDVEASGSAVAAF